MESKFWTPLEVEFLDDEKARILKPLTYQSRRLGCFIGVPAGFVTDFASVPRLPITFALTGGKAREAAVVHDFLYQTHIANGSVIKRRQADLVFLEAMAVTNIPLWRRELMYAGVRAGGFMAWRSGPSRYQTLAS